MSSYPPTPMPDDDEIPQSPLKRKLGFADYLFMAMNPHAGQLLDHLTSQHQREVDHAYKRRRDREAQELHRAQLERLQNKDDEASAEKADLRKKESFTTEQAVVKEGGHKIKSMEDLFKYDPNNTIVSRAQGEAYAVPTERTLATRKQADKDTEAKAALQRKIEEKKQMTPLEIEEATKKQAALMPGDLRKIGAQAQINAENRAPHFVQTTDDEGNVKITGVPANTTGTVDLGKVGKSAGGGKAGATGSMSARAEKTLNKTQAAIDAVKSPDAKDIRSDKERFDAAMNAVKLAVAAHPGEIEGGVDKESGWPYIKRKEGGAKAAAGGSSKDPRIGRTATRRDGTKVRVTGIDKDGDPITEIIQ